MPGRIVCDQELSEHFIYHTHTQRHLSHRHKSMCFNHNEPKMSEAIFATNNINVFTFCIRVPGRAYIIHFQLNMQSKN
jgi:hypothetical protein